MFKPLGSDNHRPIDSSHSTMRNGSPESGQNTAADAKDFPTDCREASKRYALALGDRVKSFNADPLHSGAYLAYLTRYLKTPFQKTSKRQHLYERPSPARRTFVIQYLIRPREPPAIRSFNDPQIFTSSAALPAQNEILFLTGRPSADWLNTLGSKYSLDHRFFHQHLGSIISCHRQDWNTGPDLPSRSLQVLTLRIPTVVFVGSRGRNLGIRDLEMAREKCNHQLRKAALSLQDGATADAGRSIIRRLEVHDGCTMMAEQQMTATVVHRGKFWTSK